MFEPSTKAGTLTTVTLSNSGSTQILAANPQRRCFTIWNNSGQIVHVVFDAAATTSSSIRIASGAQYVDATRCGGQVTGIMAGGTTGDVYVQEYTV